MKLLLVYNFSTGGSDDGSQGRQGPRQFKHWTPLRAHLHGTVLERLAPPEAAPSASPSFPWRTLLQAEGKMSLRARGISPGEQVNPLVILALPATHIFLECCFQCWCNCSLVQQSQDTALYVPFCMDWQLGMKAGNCTSFVLNTFESDWAIKNTSVLSVTNILH